MPSGDEIAKATADVIRKAGGDPDEDTVAYVRGILEEEEPHSADELWDLVGVFIAGAAGLGEDEDAGKALCGDLHAALFPGGSAKAAAPPPAPKAKVKLSQPLQPIAMSGLSSEASRMASWNMFTGDGDDRQQYEAAQDTLKTVARVSKKKKEKVERRVVRRQWRASEKHQDDSIWVDTPTGTSVAGDGSELRTTHLSGFSLPNKKGSGDLLQDASCTLVGGRRYGLIGKNGVGKSTFLDALARREIPGIPQVSIFYVRQEVAGDERTSLQWVIEADSERQDLLAQAKALEEGGSQDKESGARLTRIYERLEEKRAKDGTDEEKRARDILKGLGLDEELVLRQTCRLSGGWRMRVALACALFVSPGLLLLDEPTNHLDLETVIWLEHHLREVFQQTLVVVSHDRNFLNEVVTDILLFEHMKIESFKGDYYSFEATQEERRTRQQRLHEVQEEKKEHLQKYITEHGQLGSNGPNAAKQRKSRMKKLERAGMEGAAAVEGRKMKVSYDGVQEEVEAVHEEKLFTLTFPDPGSTGRSVPVCRLDGVGFGYTEGSKLFEGATFSVDVNSRVAVLGRNGCGKSTLIKILLGQLTATSGTVTKDPGCRIEYIAQHHLDQLDGSSTPMEFALQMYPEDESFNHEQRMRMHLAAFGLGGTTLPFQRIHTLSGGQRCRLSMALVMYRRPHFLIMDEPTNHLDMETSDALAAAIKTFQGGILIVSHDQHLLSKVCTELLVVRAHRVKKFDGTVEQYKKRVISGAW